MGTLEGLLRSQALLGQGRRDVLGQRGQLGRIQDVDAAGGGQARGSAPRLHPGGVRDDDFRAVIHPGFGRFPEGQLVALDLLGAVIFFTSTRTEYSSDMCVFIFFYHNIPASRSVAGIPQRADLGGGLVFKVQLHVLNLYITSAWEQEQKKSVKPTGGIARPPGFHRAQSPSVHSTARGKDTQSLVFELSQGLNCHLKRHNVHAFFVKAKEVPYLVCDGCWTWSHIWR